MIQLRQIPSSMFGTSDEFADVICSNETLENVKLYTDDIPTISVLYLNVNYLVPYFLQIQLIGERSILRVMTQVIHK